MMLPQVPTAHLTGKDVQIRVPDTLGWLGDGLNTASITSVPDALFLNHSRMVGHVALHGVDKCTMQTLHVTWCDMVELDGAGCIVL
jgi:hypothetical protein